MIEPSPAAPGTALTPFEQLTGTTPQAALPAVFQDDCPATIRRAVEYFKLSIPNEATRANYQRAVIQFCRWASARGATSIRQVQPLHIAEFIRERGQQVSKPSVIGELAALRGWFGYLAMGGFLPFNPAASVKGPRHSRTEGKTPGLTNEEAAQLLDSIEPDTLKGLRDRAMIGLMLYSGARVGAVCSMNREDFYQAGTRYYVNLHEKGGKDRTLAVHHLAAEYVHAWIEAAGIDKEPKSPLFRSMPMHLKLKPRPFTDVPPAIQDTWHMVKTRCKKAGLGESFTPHSFRVTAITNLLENGATLEEAQRLAGHADARTTALYDRRSRAVTPDLVERINYHRPARTQPAQL